MFQLNKHVNINEKGAYRMVMYKHQKGDYSGLLWVYSDLISKHCHMITDCTDLRVTGAVADHRWVFLHIQKIYGDITLKQEIR